MSTKELRVLYIDTNVEYLECQQITELFGFESTVFEGYDLIDPETCVNCILNQNWNMVKCDMPVDDLIIMLFEHNIN